MNGARRGGLLAPVLFALVAFAILVGLGTWQIERKSWKEALIATLDPARRAASAWFAPFPPGVIENEWPARVSPALGSRSTVAVRSRLIDPKTTR